MTETSFEQLVQERQFAGILQTHGESFLRLSNSLLSLRKGAWNKRHYFQLIHEADSLESFLDDYGARYNRTYAFFTELVASARWFAMTGYSLSHTLGRMGSYGAPSWVGIAEDDFRAKLTACLDFCQSVTERLLTAIREEAKVLGLELTPEAFSEASFLPVVSRRRLPRNVGQADLNNEQQKIAEVASKFLAASDMLRDLDVRPIADPERRRAYLKRVCTEEQARVYEATVHNLQSTYDTHVQNSVLEGKDERLSRLRGYLSAALHLLASVTYLAHFFERHEDEARAAEVKLRLRKLVAGDEVQAVTLDLLVLAARILEEGRGLAEALLPEYTNVLEMRVEVADGLVMHARPAALVVGIVNHHGTPVEMEVGGQVCNAASILELLVCVGSHPDERVYVFRGDENPLKDIRRLFECGLGEAGLDSLPEELAYLRS